MSVHLCRDCAKGDHLHQGECAGTAVLVFRSGAGPVEKPTPCECVTVGRSDADTQMEVAFR